MEWKVTFSLGLKILPDAINYSSLIYSFYSNSFTVTPLQVGANDYVDSFGTHGRLEIIPVRTTTQGLCYKLTLSNIHMNGFLFFIGSSIQSLDKLEKINLMIATNDTWQGIVGNKWPYTKGLKIPKEFFMTFQHSNIEIKIVKKIMVHIMN